MATTPFMSLTLPTPSVTPGPSYAVLLNAALTAIDAHNHAPGFGAQVPSSGMNIDEQLSFNGQDATELRSLRMAPQGSPLAGPNAAGCLYISGGNLYYNSGSGQQVQITAGGALNAASIGAIGGDYATSGASEYYTSSSKTFSFESSSGVKAHLDAANVTLRDATAGAKGIRLKSPAGVPADYDLTLPSALPGGTKILTVNNTGAVAAVYDADGATLEVASSALRVKDGGITNAKLGNFAVTGTKIADAQIGTTKLASVTSGTTVATKEYVDGRLLVAGQVASNGTIVSQTGSITATAGTHTTGNYTINVPGLTVNGVVLVTAGSSVVIFAAPSAGALLVEAIHPGSLAGVDTSFSFMVVKL